MTSSGLTHSLVQAPIPKFMARMMVSWWFWLWPQHHLLRETFMGRNFGEVEISIEEDEGLPEDAAPGITARLFSLEDGPSHGQLVWEHELGGQSPQSTWDGSAC